MPMGSIIEASGRPRPREDLVGAYYEFDPAGQGLIAPRVAPDLPVSREQGTYGVSPRAAWLARVNTKRAVGGDTSESGYTPDSRSFELLEYSHMQFVDRRHQSIFLDWFDAEEDATRMCAGKIDLDREIDTAALIINETNFPATDPTGVTLAGGAEWSNASGGAPMANVATAKRTLMEQFGVEANTIILPFKAAMDVPQTAEVRDRLTQLFGPVKPAEFTEAELGAIFRLPNVLIGKAHYNSADPGLTPVLTPVWSKEYAWVGRIEGGQNRMTPQSARTFLLNGSEVLIESQEGSIKRPGTNVRAERIMKVQFVGANPVGYLIKNITA